MKELNMQEIKGFDHFKVILPINKGFSNDKKYYVETQDGDKILLRLADISEYNRKKAEFDMMVQLVDFKLPISQPLEFGICNDGKIVYSLLTWCEGEDAEKVLPLLPETEQYVIGIKAGEILRKLHSIPAPLDQEEWSIRFIRKSNQKIMKYKDCGVKFDGDDKVIEYLERNQELLKNRPQSFHHGDYHVGNMVISENNVLSIIDFNRYDFGDPWEEFNRIVWSAKASPYFATGLFNGYFDGKPPLEFFRLLLYYIASNTLSSIYWAISFGEEELEIMKNQAKDVLSWFDNMNNPIPTWYLEDFYIQYIDEVPCKLKSSFDFSFLENYGKVFKVYDDQDSGNLCLGVFDGEKRYFVKFAGAPTEQYSGKSSDAVTRLKTIAPIYQELAHPTLIKFVKAEEIGSGYAVLFEWVDAECMGRMYPLSRQKFLQMPLSSKMEVYLDILSFHSHVVSKGYVAIDFYDGSIMYDFDAKKTVICDIDFYSKAPYTNTMGRMWGSSLFMSPEEYELGATIDEITNVYLMGATAFALFADYNRSIEHWKLNQNLYNVALKAVSNERTQRQQSVQQFIDEWVVAVELL